MNKITRVQLALEYAVSVESDPMDGSFGFSDIENAFLAGWKARGEADIEAVEKVVWTNTALTVIKELDEET